jgi:hypothetical protein
MPNSFCTRDFIWGTLLYYSLYPFASDNNIIGILYYYRKVETVVNDTQSILLVPQSVPEKFLDTVILRTGYT